ncbi:MAG: M23 family metallopeptidase [Treponema sp.]|nr:M23 family metallopeptidase [Treponema sp.]
MSARVGKLFFVFLAMLVPVALSAMEWPLLDATVVRNFGFNDRGRPTVGVVLAGYGEVLAAGSGEVIFSFSGANSAASRFPSPLGAWTALDHGNGLVSIYARYYDHYDAIGSDRLRVEQGTPIAIAGASGWSEQDGCYFMLFDRRERRWVNPAMIITPFPDTIVPQIHGIQLMNEDGVLVGISPGQSVTQGMYGIVVNATDALSGNRGNFLAPHRIISSVNGTEVGRFSLETISARDGVMLINRGLQVPARRVYAPFPAFEAGEAWLNRGQAILEIIVQDIAGNSSNIVAHIFVE